MLVRRSELGQIIDRLRTSELLSCDTETTGLEETDRLFAIIFADGRAEYYFDVRELGKDFLSSQPFKELFTKHLIFQNAKFDMRMLQYEGIKCTGTVSDIAVLARLVHNGHVSYSLAFQAARYGMQKDKNIDTYIASHKDRCIETRTDYLGMEYKAKRYDRVPIELMHTYACKDARLTYDLYNIYIRELPDISRKLWTTEQKLTKVLFEIERRGLKVDMHKTLAAKEYEEGLIREAKEKFTSMSGHNFDENNRKTLIKVFTDAGEAIPKTDKGNPKLDSDTLDNFTTPIAQVVKDIRYYEKRASTYYDSFLNLADRSGILRANIHQAGTTTGRFSYSEPNLQNIPKEDDPDSMARPHLVRECIVPREGHYFLSIDYSQQEYRMMLDYANEKRLIAQVMAGTDVHQATAALLSISRGYAKTVNFATLYGAGPAKLALMLGITVQQASALLDRYFMGLPRVDMLINKIRITARQRGYITNWAGRVLRCQPGFDYALPNHLIQGGCSDVVREAIVALPDAPIVLQVHDQLLFEVPVDTKPEEIHHWKTIMENVYPSRNGMKLTADAAYSLKSFAERDMIEGIMNAAS